MEEVKRVKVRVDGEPVNVKEYQYLVTCTEEDWESVPEYIGRAFALKTPGCTIEPA